MGNHDEVIRVRWRMGWLFVMLLAGLGCWGHAQADQKHPADPSIGWYSLRDIPEPESTEVLVKFRQNVTPTDLRLFNQKLHASVSDRAGAIRAFHAYFKTLPEGVPILRWQRLRLQPGMKASAFIALSRANDLIEAIEPNARVYATAISTTYTPYAAPSDTFYRDGHTLWWFNRIKGDAAYNTGIMFAGTNDVVVAIVDTGVDQDHTDFSGRLTAGRNIIAGNTNTDDDNIWFGTTLVLGHGTHAAGLIVAATNNSEATAGAAWNTHIKVMPIKALDSTGSGSVSDVAAGIIWAADNGADVINLSLGTYSAATVLQDAVTYAQGLGVLLVAAAGNDNLNLRTHSFYPALYSGVMCIAATNSLDLSTVYSNWSTPPGLLSCAAPGGAGYGWDYGVTSTANNGGWSSVIGTSFASPQVAALAAMLKFQRPTRTAGEIRDLILNTCEANPSDPVDYRGAGRMNMLAALMSDPLLPTATVSRTITRTITRTPTYTRTLTYTPTRTYSRTRTITPTPTYTQTRTMTRTFTRTPTYTHTRTITRTSTYTPTFTITRTFTRTPTYSPTRTITRTFTRTRTYTVTRTITRTFTRTPSYTPTWTITRTSTRSPTLTTTLSRTVTRTLTMSPTIPPIQLASQELRVFPQPAKDQMRIAFAYQGMGKTIVELYNAAGERVIYQEDKPLNQRGYGLTILDVRTLSSGVYILRMTVQDANGTRGLHTKIAIQH